MCGIVGFIGKPGHHFEIDKIKTLLLSNQERGKDATGIWDSSSKTTQKSIEKAEDFIINSNLTWHPANILIGHCRAGSSGGKTVDQAHPHEYENIVGVHNGTLNSLQNLQSLYNSGRFVAKATANSQNEEVAVEEPLESITGLTDSQVLFKIMDMSLSTKVLTHIKGSAALLFHDKNNPNRIYAYRKGAEWQIDKRPLYYGIFNPKNSKSKTAGIYFSSIEKSLKFIGCSTTTELKENHITIFENGELVEEVAIKTTPSNTSSISSNSNVRINTHSYSDLVIFRNRWFRSQANNVWFLGRNLENVLHWNQNDYAYIMKVTNTMGTDIDIDTTIHIKSKQVPKPFAANDDIVIMKDILRNDDTNTIVFTKGEVCKISKVYYNASSPYTTKLDVVSKVDNKVYELNTSQCREAIDDEVLVYHIDNADPSKTSMDGIDYCIKLAKQKTENLRKTASIKKKEETLKHGFSKYVLENLSLIPPINFTDVADMDNTIEIDRDSIEYSLSRIYEITNIHFITEQNKDVIRTELLEIVSKVLTIK